MTRTVKKPDIRRQELLDIGVKLFFEAGEKEISIQEVVKDVYKRQDQLHAGRRPGVRGRQGVRL